MKKAITVLLSAALLALMLHCPAALADIYINKTKPADWDERELMKLTCFGTVLNDAMLLEVGGKTMLIDGAAPKWWDEVLTAINERGLDNHVDIIYNTHPHDDHIGGIRVMVRNGLRADEFISTFPREYRAEEQQKFLPVLDAAGIPYRQIEYGEEMDFGGAHLIFWYDPTGKDSNARSSVCRITFSGASVLLTADLTGAASEYFIENFTSEQLHSDIMKVPHHGYVVMKEDFLSMVAPDFAFCTGRMSSTEHIIKQLKLHDIEYLYNSTGSIFMETDGKDWYITRTKNVF